MFEAVGRNGLRVPATGTALRRAGSDWNESDVPGFLIRPLLEDPDAGLRTWLMRTEPGACAELHDHAEIEQIYILEGELSDGQTTFGPGDYIVRAPGTPHIAASERGALALVIYTGIKRSAT